MSDENASSKQRFETSVVDDWRLDSAKTALEYRLVVDLSEHPTLETIEWIRNLEGNALTLTVPRTVTVDDIGRIANKLLEELVQLFA
jgi:hypothetical protein